HPLRGWNTLVHHGCDREFLHIFCFRTGHQLDEQDDCDDDCEEQESASDRLQNLVCDPFLRDIRAAVFGECRTSRRASESCKVHCCWHQTHSECPCVG